MRKQGPCLHCGVARTPLWRNGPPEKPVLCNACGSRYRIGKSLENYTPKTYHVVKHKKRKQAASKAIVNYEDNNAHYSPTLEGYYASSESSTTYTNYHNHRFPVKQENLDEIPVENWGSFWEAPARKRSQVVYNNFTTIQKLRIDLHNILRNENPLNNASEDVVLIYNVDVNKLRTSSTEIGHGTILLRVPDDASQEQQQQQQQIIEPCSPSVCGKVSPLNQGQTASPSLANAGSSEDIHSVQNEISPKVSEEGDDHGASPTTTTKEAGIAANDA